MFSHGNKDDTRRFEELPCFILLCLQFAPAPQMPIGMSVTSSGVGRVFLTVTVSTPLSKRAVMPLMSALSGSCTATNHQVSNDGANCDHALSGWSLMPSETISRGGLGEVRRLRGVKRQRDAATKEPAAALRRTFSEHDAGRQMVLCTLQEGASAVYNGLHLEGAREAAESALDAAPTARLLSLAVLRLWLGLGRRGAAAADGQLPLLLLRLYLCRRICHGRCRQTGTHAGQQGRFVVLKH